MDGHRHDPLWYATHDAMNLNSLTSQVRALKLPQYGESIRPVRDWFVLLAIALTILVLSLGYHMWLFIRVLQGEQIGEAQTTNPYDLSALEQVDAVFSERAAEEARYKNDYRFVDPSR